MFQAAARIMHQAKLIGARRTDPLSPCLTLVALRTAFIAMFLGALQDTREVSDH